jgi:hypothetical protein
MTAKRLIPLLSTVVCALGMAPAASAASDVAQASSQNWAGYVVGGSATTRRFAGVSGSWTQPTANCATGANRYAAFWIGLGGSGQSQALEQAGTEADCSSSGQPRYFAWYELVPKAPVHLALAVAAGDRITSTVSVSGSSVRIQLSDLTTGQSVDRTLTMASPDVTSAEWIAEAPSACDASVSSCTPLPLTDFGTVAFTGARAVTTDGHAGTISDADWSASAVSLSGTASASGGPQFSSDEASAVATPGSLSSGGSAFDVAWSALGSGTGTSGGYWYVVPGSGGSGYGYGYGGSGYGGGGYGGYGYGGGGYGGGGFGGGFGGGHGGGGGHGR